jgi:hypothetical protein
MVTINNTWYAEPTSVDTQGIWEFFNFVNNVSGSYFFAVMLLVVWGVTFISSLFSGTSGRPSASKGWIFASAVTSFLSVILAVADLLAPRWMYASFVMLGFGIIWIILENAKGY